VRWLIIAFIVVPFVELYLLLWLSRWIDFWPTVLLTIVTGWVGGNLAKREGLRVWRAYQRAVSEHRQPEQGIVDGLLVLVGGALLITPGVLTDIVGFALVVPVTRKWVASWLRARIQRQIAVHLASSRQNDSRGQHREPRGGGPRVVDTIGEDR